MTANAERPMQQGAAAARRSGCQHPSLHQKALLCSGCTHLPMGLAAPARALNPTCLLAYLLPYLASL